LNIYLLNLSRPNTNTPKKAAKIFVKSKPAFKNLSILKLDDLVKLELGKFRHKHFNNKLRKNFQNYFIKLQTIHSVNTRRQASGLNYNIPIYKIVRHQRSVKYQGVTLWHSIPHDIRKVTFCKFKKYT